jgi:adenosylcobyric acid synthase
VVTGLCRLLARKGVSVAPFKAQNMSLNSWVTDDGSEIGRSQGIQAVAAGVRAEAIMNPILLKPSGAERTQAVVLGKPWANIDTGSYGDLTADLRQVVRDSLAELRSRFEVVVCEGAGSAAEINLLEQDIVNLPLAFDSGLPAVVVGDIDLGGVLAALYGTVRILPAELAQTIRGFIVNKFRGDPTLLEPGLVELEKRTGVRTIGVIPWIERAGLDAEDSARLGQRFSGWSVAGIEREGSQVIDVAVIRLGGISNFTDLDPLDLEPQIRVRLVDHRRVFGNPDLVVIPGTKTTVTDLAWIRRSGIADAIASAAGESDGPLVLGICGGYQMLGGAISDPDGVETADGDFEGLGLLPIRTAFEVEKTVKRRSGEVRLGGARAPVDGYEIHHGRVLHEGRPGLRPSSWLRLDDGRGEPEEGCADLDQGVIGTSLHGLFESDLARTAILDLVARRRNKKFLASGVSFASARLERIDRLADVLEEHLDLEELMRIISLGHQVS